MTEEYQFMKNRIKRAKTEEQLKKLEKNLDRLYEAGIFSIPEFKRLDNILLNKYVELESN